MKMTGKYLSLTYENMSPCIVRSDRIKEVCEMPGGRSKITYGNGRVFLVRESTIKVNKERFLDNER